MVTRRTHRSADGARASEGGYTLVVLAVAVTVMSIALAAALPMWKQLIQRDKEEELIFRGWQYAEAIRVFQQRQGRLPIRLDELIKVKPRSIRRLWKDPMTKDGEWGLVFQGVGTLPGQGDQGGQGGGPGSQGGSSGEDPNGRPTGRTPPRGSNGKVVTIGPILGVHSLSTDESIKTLFGQTHYDKWLFTVKRLTTQPRKTPVGGVPVQIGGTGSVGQIPPVARARWIGRPFLPGIEPEGGLPPGGLPPGGKPPDKNRPNRSGGR
jgi:type II secretory pathway pseudopilin PulG